MYLGWRAMIRRCYETGHHSYARYGGRGITVCVRWQGSFSAFVEDMGMRPEGKTIDRINNNGNYEPGNCRWATPSEQARNRSNTIVVCVDGESHNLPEWAEKTGLPHLLLLQRYQFGWRGAKLFKPKRIQ